MQCNIEYLLDRLGNPGLFPNQLQQPLYHGLVDVLPLLGPHPVQGVLVDLVIAVHVECGVAVQVSRGRPRIREMLEQRERESSSGGLTSPCCLSPRVCQGNI